MDQLREIGCGRLGVIWAVHDNGLVSESCDPFHTGVSPVFFKGTCS
jgi:hypothetical protein